ncbi:hypothetical protein NUACC26_097730 [Scytonema sp. NUACC26]
MVLTNLLQAAKIAVDIPKPKKLSRFIWLDILTYEYLITEDPLVS